MGLIFLTLTLLSAVHATSVPPAPLPLNRSPFDLPYVGRRWVDGGPCARSDFRCMNVMALRYTNEIRARAGRYPLEMGTEYMLDNAMYHSQVQQRAGNIFHQDLGATPLGCSAHFSGENVAQNFVWATPNRATDPARICVEQLRDSPPHYKNIISDYSRASVMGIYIDGRDWIWCTQTFAVNVAYGQGKCAMANAEAGVRPQIQEQAPPQQVPPQQQAPPPQNRNSLNHSGLLRSGAHRSSLSTTSSHQKSPHKSRRGRRGHVKLYLGRLVARPNSSKQGEVIATAE